MKNILTGLIAAPSTPMHEDGSINLTIIPEYAAHLRRSGVAGVFVNGTTGESLSLTLQERLDLATAWAAVCDNDLKLIIHVGDNSLPVARQLAAQAQEIGAVATGAIAPTFFNPTVTDLADWCRQLASAAPELPFYYYHMPSRTGIKFPLIDLLEHVGDIPNFAGAKFTSEDLMDYQMAREMSDGRYDILFGRDEIFLAFLAVGAHGAVGSTYNFMAPVYLRIMEAWQSQDFATARLWQSRSQALVRILRQAHNGVACGKAILNLAGIAVGPGRAPLPTYSNGQMEELRQKLDQIGFFRWKDGTDPG